MAFIRCPECGAENNELASTCFRCGFPLKSNQAYGYQDGFQFEKTEPINDTQPLYQEAPPMPMPGKKKGLNIKLLLAMILGGVVWSLCMVWDIARMKQFLPLMFMFIFADCTMLCAMFFQTMKLKVVAIILAASGILFTILVPVMYLVRDWYSFLYALNAPTILSMIVSLLLSVLLLLYILMGEKHGDSIVWMLVFAGLAVFMRALNTGVDMFTLFLSVLMAAYYAIGYSPNKWYLRNNG